ncbi:hypothetical protein P4V72_05770 [Bacillus thuringiensis]|uniref:Uncharacterized protein n=2 Tax=root TaxID=1 RepID=A0A4P8MXT9_9CAUD|nr:hypothetical protein [Bacillus thuringiensis]YP_009845494.1 hypothetical protein HWC18_gp58 [Bacillus phage vB_BtS_B83]MEB9095246.1 hypothetical protein [Bacillus cereus]AQY42412.1 hypothetical protein B4918_31410 [Bacillus thuringiensis]MDR4148527.1 hypothetical protein [Bacillus thuringiensis]MEC3575085.1 hypothetical protein [Bacillus thuringiensis]MED2019878.1 hypothetical protein [Bacillus thuringiensis]
MNIQKRFQKAIKKNEKAMEELRNYKSNSEQVNKAITDRLIKLNENNKELKMVLHVKAEFDADVSVEEI